MPGWQKIYQELKDKNFEIVSVAQDTNGVKDAGPWITKEKLDYTVLIDKQHLVTQLYAMVNVPTAVWINEKGRIVRPNEVAYVDNRYKALTFIDADPYLAAIRDWAQNGDKSRFVVSEQDMKERMKLQTPDRAMADAEFGLGEYLYGKGFGPDAIPHFKEAQRLAPDNWNYKRQAWALGDVERDYGTTFMKEVKKSGKPFYEPRKMPDAPPKQN